MTLKCAKGCFSEARRGRKACEARDTRRAPPPPAAAPSPPPQKLKRTWRGVRHFPSKTVPFLLLCHKQGVLCSYQHTHSHAINRRPEARVFPAISLPPPPPSPAPAEPPWRQSVPTAATAPPPIFHVWEEPILLLL